MKIVVSAVIAYLIIGFSQTTYAQIGSSYVPGVDKEKQDPYAELEPIDLSHGRNQRTDVQRMFLDMGYRLKTDKTDLTVIQRMLDLRKIRRDDIATQQALGLVFGDILAKELDMDWILYEDDQGRSRALRYKKTDIVIFPVTMISRRYKAGVNVDVKALFEKVTDSTQFMINNSLGF